MSKKAIIYLNLGTPDDTKVSSVRKYLRQFLMDGYVLDIPYFFRWILVYIIIVPFRAAKSAEAYEKIWRGDSPLRSISQSLVRKLQRLYHESADILLAMRYGHPSIEAAAKKIASAKYESVTVFPAYPQYALSSTETGVDEIRKQLARCGYNGTIHFIKDYYEHPLFLEALVESIQPVLSAMKPDFILFSYHGLPKRHLTKINSTCAGGGSCCDVANEGNRWCYRRQSFATTRGLVDRLALRPDQYTVAFQSRLGSGWIEPFTDVVLEELARKGVKRLAVVCPSFTVDCLETLEEIAIRGRESFVAAGGEDLQLIPCLNDSDKWAVTIQKIVNSEG